MTVGLVGQKCGMTRVFTEQGESLPVTVIHVDKNTVTQVKALEKEGYNAIQVTYGSAKPSRVNGALKGHYAKAEVEAGKGLVEFRLAEASEMKAGQELKVDQFEEGQLVDVSALSKGKGFAGVVKRHNFATQDATHGNSLAHRAHGSTGQNQSPGKVFKGKKMAGQMGSVKTTVQSLEVVKIDSEKGLLLVKGGVPGAAGGRVVIKPAVKSKL